MRGTTWLAGEKDGVEEALYDAALAEAGWPEAFDRLVRMFGGISGNLMLLGGAVDPPEVLALPGASSTAQRLYAEYFHAKDVWVKAGLSRPPTGRSLLGQELVPAERFARSEFWNDFLKLHVGAYHMIGAALPIGKAENGRMGVVGIHRPADAKAYEANDAAALDELLPHLQRALQIRLRLRAAQERAAVGAMGLERLPFPALVFRGDGRLLVANRDAEALLGPDGAVHVRRGVLQADRRGGDSLLKLVHDAARGGAGGVLALAGSGPRVALVSPLPRALRRELSGPASGLALVLVWEQGRRQMLSPDTLRRAFGMTAAEAEVALGLLAGKSPNDIAEERRAGIATVRTQVAAVLLKVGVRRQMDLVQELSRLAVLASVSGGGR